MAIYILGVTATIKKKKKNIINNLSAYKKNIFWKVLELQPKFQKLCDKHNMQIIHKVLKGPLAQRLKT